MPTMTIAFRLACYAAVVICILGLSGAPTTHGGIPDPNRTCKLAMQGQGALDQGISLLLHCTPAEPPLAIGLGFDTLVVSTDLQGVVVNKQLRCKQEAEQSVRRHALLYLCGAHSLELPNAVVSNVDLGPSHKPTLDAILVVSASAQVTLLNGTIVGNSADSIIYVDNKSNLAVESSVFHDNTGHGISVTGGGVVVINRSKFLKNMHRARGAAVLANNTSTVTIRDSTFARNSVAEAGGAIAVDSHVSLSVNRSLFSHNSVHQVDGNGGAIAVQGASKVVLENSRYEGNQAAYAGAVDAGEQANVHVYNCTFIGNNAVIQAGALAVWKSASATLVNSRFEHNTAAIGGALFSFNSTIVIDNSVFSENKAESADNNTGGGSLYISIGSNATVTSTEISGSSAAMGGAIWVDKHSNICITECRLIGNHAAYTGGALFMTHNSSATVNKCTFVNNTAASYAGVLYAAYSSVHVASSSFTNNTAGALGGAMVVDQSKASIKSSLFINCSAGLPGRACVRGSLDVLLDMHKSGPTLQGLNDTDCSWGGAMTVADSICKIQNSSFHGNKAVKGGAIYSASSECRILRCTLTNNMAYIPTEGQPLVRPTGLVTLGLGGAIFLYNPGTAQVLVEDSVMTNNSAYGSGGAVAMRSWPDDKVMQTPRETKQLSMPEAVVLRNTTIDNNSAARFGGGILVLNVSNLQLLGSKLVSNDADLGGAVYVYASNVSVGEETILRNNSALTGAAIMGHIETQLAGYEWASLTFSGTKFINNSADDGVADIVAGPSFVLTINNSNIDERNQTVSWHRKLCRIGEYQDSTGYCRPCPTFEYSLDVLGDSTSFPCKPCNSSAYCPGGAVIVADSGFWHSDNRSCSNCTLDYIIRCPNPTACTHDTTGLAEVHPHSSSVPYTWNMPSNYTEKQCNGSSAAYTGLLCGSCKQGFGQTAPFTCQPCLGINKQGSGHMHNTGIIVLFAVYCLALAVFVMFTSWTSLVSNKSQLSGYCSDGEHTEMMHVVKALVIYSTYIKIIAKLPLAWVTSEHSMHSAGASADAAPTAVSKVMKLGTEAIGWVSGVAFGSAVSLDCVLAAAGLAGLPPYVKVALKGYINLAGPVVVFALAILLRILWWCIKARVSGLLLRIVSHWFTQWSPVSLFFRRMHLRCRNEAPLAEYLRAYALVTLLVTTFYWYPTWVRVAMGSLACVCICEMQRESSGRSYCPDGCEYWVQDMTITCPTKKGGPLSWALSVSVPAWLLTIGVPVVVIALLLWGIRRKLTQTAWYVGRFGFLYSDYRCLQVPPPAASPASGSADAQMQVAVAVSGSKLRSLYHRLSQGFKSRLITCWNAVLHVQTVIVSFIAVYGVLLHEYYQVLILTSALGMYYGLVVWLRPFRSPPIQRLQSLSLAVLAFTSLATFSFIQPADLDERQKREYNIASEVVLWVVVVINALFLTLALGLLAFCAVEKIKEWVDDKGKNTSQLQTVEMGGSYDLEVRESKVDV